MMGMSLTSKTTYKLGCGPFAPEIYRLDFPNYYHFNDGLSEADFADRELAKFREAFSLYAPAEHVAAVILEVVQGEGGFAPVPKRYLQGLRAICTEHNILLILDEVQSGFCRTGRWAGYEHYDVVPDLSTWAKSMGSGMPISAVVGRADIMDAALPGTIGGTYGGNPVACAAALAVLDVIRDEGLLDRSMVLGKSMTTRLRAVADRKSVRCIGEVRGLGAMVAVELVSEVDGRTPDADLAKAVATRCFDNGLIVLSCGLYGNVLRILVPLTATDPVIDEGMDMLEQSLVAVAQRTAA
jgi:4-aminobutyrate aminotransferase/(S)-3-amino-2-methylpropionate transaminase